MLIFALLLAAICGSVHVGVRRRAFISLSDGDSFLTEQGQLFASTCVAIALTGVLLLADPLAALAWAIAFTIAPLLTFIVSLPPLKQPTAPIAHAYYARYVDRDS